MFRLPALRSLMRPLVGLLALGLSLPAKHGFR